MATWKTASYSHTTHPDQESKKGRTGHNNKKPTKKNENAQIKCGIVKTNIGPGKSARLSFGKCWLWTKALSFVHFQHIWIVQTGFHLVMCVRASFPIILSRAFFFASLHLDGKNYVFCRPMFIFSLWRFGVFYVSWYVTLYSQVFGSFKWNTSNINDNGSLSSIVDSITIHLHFFVTRHFNIL